MSSIPMVPTSQFVNAPKAKMIDGRKKNRKRFTIEVLPPRMAKGRMPRQAFGKPMHYAERPVTMGDKVFEQGPIADPHNDPYLKS